MLPLALMRGALSSFSVTFGSLGVFFLYHSFSAPALAAYAVMFLGTATAIEIGAKKKSKK